MLARQNPFRTERVLAVRYRTPDAGTDAAPDATLAAIAARLFHMGGRGALVGPQGSGKTTLLEDLEAPLQARGLECHFLRLNWECRNPPADFWQQELGSGQALLIDGAEVLRRWQWARVRRHAAAIGALVVTSHRPGLLPTLLQTGTSPRLLGDILLELGHPLLPDRTERLWRQHKGDLRLVLRQLYDCAQAPPQSQSDSPSDEKS